MLYSNRPQYVYTFDEGNNVVLLSIQTAIAMTRLYGKDPLFYGKMAMDAMTAVISKVKGTAAPEEWLDCNEYPRGVRRFVEVMSRNPLTSWDKPAQALRGYPELLKYR